MVDTNLDINKNNEEEEEELIDPLGNLRTQAQEQQEQYSYDPLGHLREDNGQQAWDDKSGIGKAGQHARNFNSTLFNLPKNVMQTFGAGTINAVAGASQFLHLLRPNVHYYNSLVDKYGSIERAHKAGADVEPRWLEGDTPDTWLLQQTAESMKQLTDDVGPEIDTDYLGMLQEGDYAGYVENAILGGVFNMPNLVGRGIATGMFGPKAGALMLFGSSTGSTYLNYKDIDHISSNQQMGASILHGLSEVFASQIYSAPMLNKLTNQVGEQATRQLIERTASSSFQQLALGAVGGFTEEMAVSAGQQVADYVMAVNRDVDAGSFMRNVVNSGMGGMHLGILMGGSSAVQDSTTVAGLLNQVNEKNETMITPDTQQMQEQMYPAERGEDLIHDVDSEIMQPEAEYQRQEYLDDLVERMEPTFADSNNDRDQAIQILQYGLKYAEKLNIDDYTVLALIAKESNFRDVGTEVLNEAGEPATSATGPLQVTRGAFKDIEAQMDNSFETLEGRIEAGVRYLAHMRDHHGLSGDEAIGAYFAGVGYIKTHGLTSEGQAHGQSGAQQYVQDFHEYYAIARGLEYDSTRDIMTLPEDREISFEDLHPNVQRTIRDIEYAEEHGDSTNLFGDAISEAEDSTFVMSEEHYSELEQEAETLRDREAQIDTLLDSGDHPNANMLRQDQEAVTARLSEIETEMEQGVEQRDTVTYGDGEVAEDAYIDTGVFFDNLEVIENELEELLHKDELTSEDEQRLSTLQQQRFELRDQIEEVEQQQQQEEAEAEETTPEESAITYEVIKTTKDIFRAFADLDQAGENLERYEALRDDLVINDQTIIENESGERFTEIELDQKIAGITEYMMVIEDRIAVAEGEMTQEEYDQKYDTGFIEEEGYNEIHLEKARELRDMFDNPENYQGEEYFGRIGELTEEINDIAVEMLKEGQYSNEDEVIAFLEEAYGNNQGEHIYHDIVWPEAGYLAYEANSKTETTGERVSFVHHTSHESAELIQQEGFKSLPLDSPYRKYFDNLVEGVTYLAPEDATGWLEGNKARLPNYQTTLNVSIPRDSMLTVTSEEQLNNSLEAIAEKVIPNYTDGDVAKQSALYYLGLPEIQKELIDEYDAIFFNYDFEQNDPQVMVFNHNAINVEGQVADPVVAVDDLLEIKGVGIKTAEAINEYIQNSDRIVTEEALLNIKGVGQATLNNLKEAGFFDSEEVRDNLDDLVDEAMVEAGEQEDSQQEETVEEEVVSDPDEEINEIVNALPFTDNELLAKTLESLGYDTNPNRTQTEELDSRTLSAFTQYKHDADFTDGTGLYVDGETGLTPTRKAQRELIRDVIANEEVDPQLANEVREFAQFKDEPNQDWRYFKKGEQMSIWEQGSILDNAVNTTLNKHKEETISKKQGDAYGLNKTEIRIFGEKHDIDEGSAEEYINVKNIATEKLNQEAVDFLTKELKPTDFKGRINTTQMNNAPIIKNVIDYFAQKNLSKFDHLNEVRTKLGMEENARALLENKSGEELAGTMGALKRVGDRLNQALEHAPEVVMAYKMVVDSLAQDLHQNAVNYKDKLSAVSDLELLQFKAKNDVLAMWTYDLQHLGQNLGRAMSSFNWIIDGENIDIQSVTPEMLTENEHLRDSVDKAIRNAGGRKTLESLLKDIADSDPSTKGITQNTRRSKGSRIVEALVEYTTGNLLRGFRTLQRNPMSQLLNIGMDATVNFLNAGISLPQNVLASANRNATDMEQANEDTLMTFKEASKRLGADLAGMVQAFTSPVMTVGQAGTLVTGNPDFTKADLGRLFVTDQRQAEKIMALTQMGRRTESEGLRTPRIASEFLFENLDTDVPLNQFIAGATDRIGSVLRLTSFMPFEMSDRAFSNSGYFSGITGQIHIGRENGLIRDAEHAKLIRDTAIALRQVEMGRDQLMTNAQQEAQLGDITIAESYKKMVDSLTEGQLKGVSKEDVKLARDIDAKAKEHSQYMTWKDSFDDSTTYGKGFKAIEHLANNVPFLGRAWRVVQPFMHTSLKMLEKTVDHALPFTKQHRANMTGKNGIRARNETFAKTAFTGAFMFSMLMKAGTGELTAPARDEEERRRFERAGIVPASIKLNGKWYEYNNMGTVGHLIRPVAIFHREMLEASADIDRGEDRVETITKMFGNTFFLTMGNAMDTTAFRGMMDTTDAIQGRNTEQFIQQQFSKLNPLYTASSNWEDFSYGGLNPFYEEIYYDRDGYARRDVLGDPIYKKYFNLGTFISEESMEPIDQQVLDLEINLTDIQNQFLGVELTTEQRYRLRTYLGEEIGARDLMNDLVTDKRYKDAPVAQKRILVRRAWNEVLSQAYSQLGEDREFIDEWVAEQEAFYDHMTDERDINVNSFFNESMYDEKGTAETLLDLFGVR